MQNVRRFSSPSFCSTVVAVAVAAVLAVASAHATADASGLTMPIVGGEPVKRGDWPDVVAVFAEDGSVCTGTLLGADLVLTAGHCIGGKPYEVIIGSVDLARSEGHARAVKWSKAYPNWAYRYDIGVVMLENPVLVKQRAVAERCTTGQRNRLQTGTRLQVVGFGLTTPTATDNNTRLHGAMIDVVDGLCERDRACNEAVAPGGEFTAGGNGVDACFGDSGGPVYISTSSGPALVGVVSRGLASWAEPCGEGGVFVRAEQVLAWVEEVTGRLVDRVECDLPSADDPNDGGGGGDSDSDSEGSGGAEAARSGGCNASGAGGMLGNALVLVFAGLCVASFRLARMRRLRPHRRRAA